VEPDPRALDESRDIDDFARDSRLQPWLKTLLGQQVDVAAQERLEASQHTMWRS
jgi:hypothetical protein